MVWPSSTGTQLACALTITLASTRRPSTTRPSALRLLPLDERRVVGVDLRDEQRNVRLVTEGGGSPGMTQLQASA